MRTFSRRRRMRFAGPLAGAGIVAAAATGWFWYANGADAAPSRDDGPGVSELASHSPAPVPEVVLRGAARAKERDAVPSAPDAAGPATSALGAGGGEASLAPRAGSAGARPRGSLGAPASVRGLDEGDDPPALQVALEETTAAKPAPAQADAPRPPAANGRVAAASKRFEGGDAIGARAELNRMLSMSTAPAEQRELRAALARIADETLFSERRYNNDPLTDLYTIESGDLLVRVGAKFDVPHDILMTMNNIRDARAIRAGQRIKVPRGPFHLRISKSEFRMDVYLQDTYVRSYPVGLGAEQGTPEGTWTVKERLENPTYFPPASAAAKRIIAPNDPANPLGERWIGLKGIAGGAVGREGYGIHGTIEPQSIGKAASLGCVRMHNPDVAFVYALVAPGKSHVTIVP